MHDLKLEESRCSYPCTGQVSGSFRRDPYIRKDFTSHIGYRYLENPLNSIFVPSSPVYSQIEDMHESLLTYGPSH